MKKLGIIIISLLICETSYAGYITIEKEKIIIGDGTKVIGELPIQKRVEVVGETKNRYIIKYNSHLAGIDKKCLRFPKDEQPYIYPYVGMSEQIYEVTLELYKGEEYKVMGEDKTRYLIEYTFKDTPIEIWVEKNYVSYTESSKQEIYEKQQIAKGLVKYQDRWVTPEEKFELEQQAKGLIKHEGEWLTYEQVREAKGLIKYQEGEWITPDELSKRKKELIKSQKNEFNTHREILDKYILNLTGLHAASSKLKKGGISQKYNEFLEFRTLIAINIESECCLRRLEQIGKRGSAEHCALLEINKKYKKELAPFIKRLKLEPEQYTNAVITNIRKEGFEQWTRTLPPMPMQVQLITFFSLDTEGENTKIQKSEFDTHIKLFDKYMLAYERFREDSSRLSKDKLLRKYSEDFKFNTLTAIDNEFEYCLGYIKQSGVFTEEYSYLVKVGEEYKKELVQWAKTEIPVKPLVEPHPIPYEKKIPQEPLITKKETEISQESSPINITVEKLKDSTARYLGHHVVLDKVFIDGVPKGGRLGLFTLNGLYITPYDTYAKGLCFSLKQNIVTSNFMSEQEPDNFCMARITCEIKAAREKGETKYYSAEIYKIEIYGMDESIERAYQ